MMALRELDTVRIVWGNETTAPNTVSDELAALIGISGVFYFYCAHTTEDDLAYCINDYLSRAGEKLKLFQYPCKDYEAMPGLPMQFTGEFIREFNRENAGTTAFSLLANNAEEEFLPGHYTLQACYYPHRETPSCIQFCFPVGFLMEQHPGYLHEMVVAWSQRLRPFHGTVGLATILTTYINTATVTGGSIYPYLQCFPCLQPDRPLFFRMWLDDGILGVNWYTLVSDGLLAKIGGKAAVAGQLDERFMLWDYPGGTGIVAGPLPETGDREKGLLPVLYTKLHSLFRPIYSQGIKRIVEHLPKGIPTEQYDKEWLYRYDAATPVATAVHTSPVPAPQVCSETCSGSFLTLCFSGMAREVTAALQAGADPNQVTASNHTPLLLGAQNTAGVVAALLAAGADPNIKGGGEGSTPLMLAVCCEKPDTVEKVRLLLEAGAAVDDRNDARAWTALIYAAARRDNTAAAALLLEAGADVNAKSDIGLTPLLKACSAGSPLSFIHLLLAAGADTKAVTDGGVTALTALNYRVLEPEEALEIFTLLLHAGAEVNVVAEITESTPLTNAIRRHAPPEIVAWLLEAGADVNLKAEDGYSAIEWAAWKGVYPEVAAMLIEAGAVYDRKFILAAARQNVFTDVMLQTLEKIA